MTAIHSGAQRENPDTHGGAGTAERPLPQLLAELDRLTRRVDEHLRRPGRRQHRAGGSLDGFSRG
ncbi:hypothetical protein [Amycolatopsis echigonensis]|uniref:Uncharacterized protein n=1 Tax=Amycolatopsis echigonensis TaxID=2576905 RepID=A0A8E2B831_9PSEU|nr:MULTISPECIES: hypothetical protein [Amycolatopsis]MBB2504586.1 hypothetical protein [Amycolatopsis echigonensis]